MRKQQYKNCPLCVCGSVCPKFFQKCQQSLYWVVQWSTNSCSYSYTAKFVRSWLLSAWHSSMFINKLWWKYKYRNAVKGHNWELTTIIIVLLALSLWHIMSFFLQHKDFWCLKKHLSHTNSIYTYTKYALKGSIPFLIYSFKSSTRLYIVYKLT